MEVATLAEKMTTEGLSRGYSGTAKTIEKMHALAAKGKLDPSMHQIATLIRLSVPEDLRGSTKATAEAVYRWVKKHGIFQRDPFQIERIDHPISSMHAIIEARKTGAYNGPGLFVGDCDTFSIWTAALGGLLGFNYAFETAKCDPQRPEEFSHVWTALRVGDEWIAYDASTPRSTPGWRPPMAGPEQFKRWPEEAIEVAMGMGEGEDVLPMDYFGNGVPREFDWTEPKAEDVDPGNMTTLVPNDTQVPMADMEPGVEAVAKEDIPLAGDRPSLTEGDETFNTGPRYLEGRQQYYKEVRGPYPLDSGWNRIRVDEGHRSLVPKGSEFHISRSTVPSMDVDIVDGVSVPISKSEEAMNAVDGKMVIMRPRRVSAGMGAFPRAAAIRRRINMSVPRRAYLQPGDSMGMGDIFSDALNAVGSVVNQIAPTVLPAASQVAQAAITAKLNQAVASATNRLTGGAVSQPQTIQVLQQAAPSTKPWYMQTWVWLGGGLAALGIGYVALKK